MSVLDLSKRHHRYFDEIAKIPHGSYHEKQISDYLVAFAKAHGLPYVQDEMYNVVMYRPASPGYEDHPAVAMQAHMDMVWEKDPDYVHDFLKDPIELTIEDGFLTAVHTTLGIDDGSGVAYMLAVLDDPACKAPALEAIFTVQEEVGMFGAQALDKSLIHADRLISLDCGGGDDIYVSSLGGKAASISLPLLWESIGGRNIYRLRISGLRNGYSTDYVEGAENAIELAGEVLTQLNEKLPIGLVSVSGGAPGGKAAGAASAVFAVRAEEETLEKAVSDILKQLEKDTKISEPHAEFRLEKSRAERCCTAESTARLLDLLAAIPCGATVANSHNPTLIGAVWNWTRAQTEEEGFRLWCTLRTESGRKLDRCVHQLQVLTKLLGAELTLENSFSPWEFDPQSQMCTILKEVFRRKCGKELGTVEVQGGLECGIFAQMGRKMDIITLGPYGESPHTTQERCLLESYDKIFDVFVDFLAAL